MQPVTLSAWVFYMALPLYFLGCIRFAELLCEGISRLGIWRKEKSR